MHYQEQRRISKKIGELRTKILPSPIPLKDASLIVNNTKCLCGSECDTRATIEKQIEQIESEFILPISIKFLVTLNLCSNSICLLELKNTFNLTQEIINIFKKTSIITPKIDVFIQALKGKNIINQLYIFDESSHHCFGCCKDLNNGNHHWYQPNNDNKIFYIVCDSCIKNPNILYSVVKIIGIKTASTSSYFNSLKPFLNKYMDEVVFPLSFYITDNSKPYINFTQKMSQLYSRYGNYYYETNPFKMVLIYPALDKELWGLRRRYNCLYIDFIGVEKKGCGDGSNLLNNIIKICDEENIHLVLWITKDYNEDNLLSFYQKFGFEKCKNHQHNKLTTTSQIPLIRKSSNKTRHLTHN